MRPALAIRSGARRAKAGLATVPLSSDQVKAVGQERSACALVAILPPDAAPFILEDSASKLSILSSEQIARRLVDVLAPMGSSSLDNATSTLGRLLTWVADSYPAGTEIEGSEVRAWFAAKPPPQSTLHGLKWLKDHCGIDLPARGLTARRFKGAAPSTTHDKESFSLTTVLGLEHIAANHSSPFVRGHAAGWVFLARHSLRIEQSTACVINAVHPPLVPRAPRQAHHWRGPQG